MIYILNYKKIASKEEEVTIDTGFEDSCKRQIEIYQWLFFKAGPKLVIHISVKLFSST